MILRRLASTGLLAASLLAPLPAPAHEGHDHGDSPAVTAAPSGSTVVLSKEAQFLLHVRTAMAATERVARQVVVNGKLVPQPQGQADVVAPVSGVLAQGSPLPAFGARVRRGQLLAVVEQTLPASDLLQARTGLAQAEANLRQVDANLIAAANEVAVAKANWERLQRLAQVVAGKEIPQAEQTYRAAVARQQALQAQQRQLRQQLAEFRSLVSGGGARRFELKSPIDGTIAYRDAVTGGQVGPDKRLYTIVDTRRLWVEGQVFESDLATVEAVQKATVRCDAFPGESFPGQVISLGQVVDDATRTVKAVFAVDNPQGRLRIGQFVRLTLTTPELAPQVTVPKAAVHEQQGKYWLFVKTKPETFERREVVPGEAFGDRLVIQKGVSAGERVVTQGSYQLLQTRSQP